MSHVRERSFLPMESEEETFFFIIMSNRTFRSLYFGKKSGFKMRFFAPWARSALGANLICVCA